ncbi:DUF3043 domain-containing protein [Corynebacterium bovis]|uniref:DUF3043 domain-containing protein n=1 Tax=Corynebacterium bovis TaxID=36808 RepID=UPI003138F11A
MKIPSWKSRTSGDESTTTADAHDAATAVPVSAQADTRGPAPDETDDATLPKSRTPKKGRPTPKRNEVERRAGVRKSPYDAPLTPAEARKRRKEAKASMSREEYKAMKRRDREKAAAARRTANERMMAGDERYLMPRDQGEVRRFVRDWVDSHRYLMNFFMPVALVVLVIMFVGLKVPAVSQTVSIALMILVIVMAVEGLLLGRRVNREARDRFPGTTETGVGLGFYAFSRATMIRRMRTPAPQVAVGEVPGGRSR